MMRMENNNDRTLLRLQEISQAEFREHMEDDDFFLMYGNPVIVNCDDRKRLLAIAWPLAERLLRAAGRGEEVEEVIRQASER